MTDELSARAVSAGFIRSGRCEVQRVDRTDGGRQLRDLVAKRDDVLLVRDRDIEPSEIRLVYKPGDLILCEAEQVVGVSAQSLVYFLGIAVDQRFSYQSVFFHIYSLP